MLSNKIEPQLEWGFEFVFKKDIVYFQGNGKEFYFGNIFGNGGGFGKSYGAINGSSSSYHPKFYSINLIKY